MPKPRSRANGEGTIFKRTRNGNTKWYAELVIGYDAEGQKKVLRHSADTRKEVADQLARWQTDKQVGTLVAPTKETVAAFLDDWMEKVVAHHTKETTQNTYRWIVNSYLKPALGRTELGKLSPDQVQDMLHEKHKAGLAPRTVLHIYTVLHTALKHAALQMKVPLNVADRVKRPKADKAKMNILNPEQGRRFLQAIQEDRFHALYMLALYLAIRQGELLGLRWSDVDWEKGTITIAQTISDISGHLIFNTPKSESSRRTLDVPAPALADLKKWRAEYLKERLLVGEAWVDPDLAFPTGIGTKYSANNLRKRSLPKLLKDADCPPIQFRELRHTGISMMIGMGLSAKDVQEIAGHADVSTTLNVYSHVWKQQKTAAAQKIGDFWTAADKQAR